MQVAGLREQDKTAAAAGREVEANGPTQKSHNRTCIMWWRKVIHCPSEMRGR